VDGFFCWMLLGGFEFVLKPRVICYVSYDKTHTAEVKGGYVLHSLFTKGI